MYLLVQLILWPQVFQGVLEYLVYPQAQLLQVDLERQVDQHYLLLLYLLLVLIVLVNLVVLENQVCLVRLVILVALVHQDHLPAQVALVAQRFQLIHHPLDCQGVLADLLVQ